MTGGPSHERPILVVLGRDEDPGDAVARLLERPEVRRFRLPAPWDLELAGLGLGDDLPEARTVTLENLPQVVDAFVARATPERLERLVARVWREVDEQVRSWYLARSLGQTVAAILRVAPRSVDRAPPPRFVEDRVHQAAFEVQYRLAAPEGERNLLAPAEEASIVLYPFDPTDRAGRREAGLEEGPEPVLEVFAYGEGRERHRDFLRASAERSWRVIDPEETPGSA